MTKDKQQKLETSLEKRPILPLSLDEEKRFLIMVTKELLEKFKKGECNAEYFKKELTELTKDIPKKWDKRLQEMAKSWDRTKSLDRTKSWDKDDAPLITPERYEREMEIARKMYNHRNLLASNETNIEISKYADSLANEINKTHHKTYQGSEMFTIETKWYFDVICEDM